ncbi:SPOR domain-containing protein [Ensifer aridi]|uniref:SPOR domain-containing protein n=1 Tax=Ensifer aridi TaxID=1708715 RepID=UPI000A10693F|nr:SPOR domain-containing protein [Ensifer aridi]
MADKQFARSGPAEFDTLADDDPLSELARIVGYDARPAVQQLQELQRHQETMRREPAFDLEEELLRAFDSYDSPRAAPVRPDSGLIEHPSAGIAEEPSSEQPVEAAPAVEDVASAEHRSAPIEQAPVEVVSPVSVPDPFAVEEKTIVDEPQAVEAADDLERELELSLGYNLPLDAAEGEVAQPAPEPKVDELPAFYDWQEPLSSKLAAAGKLGEQAAEPVYFDMAADHVSSVDVKRSEGVAATEAAAPSQPAAASVGGDGLLADVERFPVSLATGMMTAAAEPVVQERAAPAVKKNNYPFTPMFSRATPVASPTGVSPQRAFASPMTEPAAAKAAAAPAVLPDVPEVVPAAPQFVAKREPEAEVEPSFDIENFELELADIALDIDLAEEDAEEAAPSVAEQPIASHPALVESPAQPFLQALGVPKEPELRADQPRSSAPEVVEEQPTESPLPFDPAMIGETESGVAPIADLDVPQLPVLEAEEKSVPYPADYDLDIDAEMAQLFATPAPAAKSGAHAGDADLAAAPASPAKAAPALASIDDFDEFEKAMEEDFQRSMAERRGTVQEVERMAAAPRADADDYAEQGYGRRSQRTMLLAASVAGIIILGGAGVYAWMGGSNAVLSGDGPKIILADKDPVKVVPEEKGGKTVPNQDKAVYDRVAGDKNIAPSQEALVSSTEEPMDVVQRTLTPETLPLEGSNEADGLAGVPAADEDEVARLLPDGDGVNAEDAEAAKGPAVTPRKVRTMIVKPDGTLVQREEPAAQPESVAVASAEPIPARASGEAVASGSQGKAAAADASAELRAAGQPAADTNEVALSATEDAVGELAPVRSVKTTAVGNEAAPRPQTRPAGEAGAGAVQRPAESQPATQTASAEQTAPLATASVPAGSYVIQIASLPSEAEAQKSYNNLSAKFASVIGGRGVDIRKAEIAGKGTYYRVRIPAGSREEANALCSKYKSAGGSCLVTK